MNYTIKTSGSNSIRPRYWVIEVSNDNINWEIVDKQDDCEYMNNYNRMKTFSININDKSYDVQWDFSIEDLRQISGIPNGKRYKTFLGFYPYDSSITVDSALFQPDQIIDACAKSNFRIFIYDTCTREKLTINVYPCETIHNLRVRISALKKIDSNSFRLIFMGTQLNDKQNFYESKISKDATINLIMTKT